MANVLPNGNPDHLRNRSPNSTYFLRNKACSTLFLHIRDMKAIHLDGVVVIPQLSLVESRDRHAHILLPPHELGSTEIYANSITHSPSGTCSMSSESTLLSRGGTRRLGMVRMPSGKASGKLKP